MLENLLQSIQKLEQAEYTEEYLIKFFRDFNKAQQLKYKELMQLLRMTISGIQVSYIVLFFHFQFDSVLQFNLDLNSDLLYWTLKSRGQPNFPSSRYLLKCH